MKAHHFAACLAALALSAASTDARAQVVANLADADHLVDRNLTLAPGASVTIATTGCSGIEDTVLHLLERVSPTSTTFYTVAYNDDFAGTLCSSITATNNTGSSKNLVLLAVAYSGTPAVVDLSFTYTGGGTSVTQTNLTVRGVRRLGAWGASDRTAPLNRRPTSVMTKPLTPLEGVASAERVSRIQSSTPSTAA